MIGLCCDHSIVNITCTLTYTITPYLSRRKTLLGGYTFLLCTSHTGRNRYICNCNIVTSRTTHIDHSIFFMNTTFDSNGCIWKIKFCPLYITTLMRAGRHVLNIYSRQKWQETFSTNQPRIDCTRLEPGLEQYLDHFMWAIVTLVKLRIPQEVVARRIARVDRATVINDETGLGKRQWHGAHHQWSLPARLHGRIWVGATLQEEFDSFNRRSHRTRFKQWTLANFYRWIDISAPLNKSLNYLCITITRCGNERCVAPYRFVGVRTLRQERLYRPSDHDCINEVHLFIDK